MQLAKRFTRQLAAMKSTSLWKLHGYCARFYPVHMQIGELCKGWEGEQSSTLSLF